MEMVEISSLDIRLSHIRQKDTAAERRLLISIQNRDILDPLQIVEEQVTGKTVLLDGFKRYRCARKLGISMVPVECIGTDTVLGILTMLRRGDSRGITTMEQAALIEELHTHHAMSIYDIAVHLERSASWVSMRLGMLDELSALVRGKIMSGAFPARAYLYGLKGFTRVNRIPMKDVDACVKALSGKGLSTRDLFVLSRAWFNNGESVRRLIEDGDVHRALRILKGELPTTRDLPENTYVSFMDDLSRSHTDIRRLLHTVEDVEKLSGNFAIQVNYQCSLLIHLLPMFETMIMELYEKTRPPVDGADIS